MHLESSENLLNSNNSPTSNPLLLNIDNNYFIKMNQSKAAALHAQNSSACKSCIPPVRCPNAESFFHDYKAKLNDHVTNEEIWENVLADAYYKNRKQDLWGDLKFVRQLVKIPDFHVLMSIHNDEERIAECPLTAWAQVVRFGTPATLSLFLSHKTITEELINSRCLYSLDNDTPFLYIVSCDNHPAACCMLADDRVKVTEFCNGGGGGCRPIYDLAWQFPHEYNYFPLFLNRLRDFLLKRKAEYDTLLDTLNLPPEMATKVWECLYDSAQQVLILLHHILFQTFKLLTLRFDCLNR